MSLTPSQRNHAAAMGGQLKVHHGFGEVGLLGAEVVAGLLAGLLCSPLFSAVA